MHEKVPLGIFSCNLDVSDSYSLMQKIMMFYQRNIPIFTWILDNIDDDFHRICDRITLEIIPYRHHDEFVAWFELRDESERMLWSLRPDDISPMRSN